MSSSETLRLGTTPSRSSVTRSSYWHPCLSKSRPNNNSKRPPPPAPLVVNGARDNTGKAAKHTPGVENQDSDNNGSKGKDNKAHDESREDNDDWEKLSNSCDTLCAWDGSDEEEEREDRRGEQAEWDQDQQTFQSVAGQGLWSDPIDNSLWRENRIQDRDERLVALWKAYFGAGTMKDWQRLMTDLGFVGEFTSKTQCRKVSGVKTNPLARRTNPPERLTCVFSVSSHTGSTVRLGQHPPVPRSREQAPGRPHLCQRTSACLLHAAYRPNIP